MLYLDRSTTPALLARPDPPAVIIDRVRGEFREMPGLTLTFEQAGRLWNLDAPTCSDVLQRLVDTGFLCRRANGAFCRATPMN